MTIWNKSTMTTLFHSADPSEEYPCVVKIDKTEIIVEYDGDEGITQYKGTNSSDGHFELICPSLNGRATLHRFPNSLMLEGNWVEDGYRGMWTIDLSDE